MNTITTILKSRTAWTAFAMFLVGGVGAVSSLIPTGDMVFVQGFLGLLTVYFHINPSQTYN